MRRTNPWRRSDSQCPDCGAEDCPATCLDAYYASKDVEPTDGEAAEPRVEGGGGLGPYWTRLGIGR